METSSPASLASYKKKSRRTSGSSAPYSAADAMKSYLGTTRAMSLARLGAMRAKGQGPGAHV